MALSDPMDIGAKVDYFADTIRIEVVKVNGTPFHKIPHLVPGAKEFTDQEISDVWSETLDNDLNLVLTIDQYRSAIGIKLNLHSLFVIPKTLFILKGLTRLVYRLKSPANLMLLDDPFFFHELHAPSGISLYSCKFLDLHQLPPALIGSEVKVFVRYTNGEVPLEHIDNWMKLYGEPCSASRYCSKIIALLNSFYKVVYRI